MENETRETLGGCVGLVVFLLIGVAIGGNKVGLVILIVVMLIIIIGGSVSNYIASTRGNGK